MFWTRGTGSKPGLLALRQQWMSVAACVLALLLVGAATFSRPWHALEFKTFDVLTALAAPYRSTLPW